MPGLPGTVVTVEVPQYDYLSGGIVHPFVFFRVPFVRESVDGLVVVDVVIYVEKEKRACVCHNFDSRDVAVLYFYLLDL